MGGGVGELFLTAPTDNETWIIEAGDVVIQKKASVGLDSLTKLERLIYCFWVADYGLRNAGDLDVALDLYEHFHSEGASISSELGLTKVKSLFAMPLSELQCSFLLRFEEVCDEIRKYSSQCERRS